MNFRNKSAKYSIVAHFVAPSGYVEKQSNIQLKQTIHLKHR